ncbi:MAG: C25 family cysteine peptidase, partial [bacterium]|nr:C25 family cysteine peptidase [bacterium]
MNRRLILAILLTIPFSYLNAEWVSLGGAGQGAPEVRVIEATDSKVVMEFKLSGYYLDIIEIDGKPYSKIVLPGVVTFLEKGLPALPKLSKSVIIPDNAMMNYRVAELEYEIREVYPVIPSKGNLYRNIDPATVSYTFSEFYNKDEWFPKEVVELHNPFIIRDFRGQTIELHPFQYNPVRKELKVIKRVVIEVYQSGIGGQNIKIRRGKHDISREFYPLYENLFINFLPARYDTIAEKAGRMLIITKDSYYNNILPLVEWKKQKGIPTKVVKISEVGNTQTNIKNYIQTEYNTEGVTFVLLVGNGDDIVPARGTVGHASGETADPVYMYLEGNDYYPDAFISRFSANNATHVDNQVARSIKYEKEPELGGSWYCKGTGIASNQSGGEGIPDYERANWIRDTLLNYTYTSVDKIYDPYGTTSMIRDSVNAGRSIINYLGHGWYDSWGNGGGFTVSDVHALTNTNKLPFIISVACFVGEFVNTIECFCEAWLWAGTPAEPNGAIAHYGSTIPQSWDPPCYAQFEASMLFARGRMTTAGGTTFNGSCWMIQQLGNDGVEMFQTWHLFGDASVQLRNNTPYPTTVNYQPVIPVGEFDLTVSVGSEGAPINEALVCAKLDTIFVSRYTNTSGEATLPIVTTEPCTLWITVTGHNLQPYEGYALVIVPATVIINPDTITVNTATNVSVTVLDTLDLGISDVVVRISGIGVSKCDTTGASGEVIINVNSPYGEVLSCKGRKIGESWDLFKDSIWVIGDTLLTSPDISAQVTEIGTIDTLTPYYEGTITARTGGNSGFTLFTKGCGVDTSVFTIG